MDKGYGGMGGVYPTQGLAFSGVSIIRVCEVFKEYGGMVWLVHTFHHYDKFTQGDLLDHRLTTGNGEVQVHALATKAQNTLLDFSITTRHGCYIDLLPAFNIDIEVRYLR
jgi:hypothetical protein